MLFCNIGGHGEIILVLCRAHDEHVDSILVVLATKEEVISAIFQFIYHGCNMLSQKW